MGTMNLGILFILGIGVFGGVLGAWLSRKLHSPQVVGYIAIGLIIGQSGLQMIKSSDIITLQPFNIFALGIIGFLVGGELRLTTFKKYAAQFSAILFGEGLGAFFLVGTVSTLLIYHITGSFSAALAAGIVLGAIASATDPASTIDVLWEYRARGVLTTAIIAVIALDDALAMGLYGFGTSAAQILTGTSADWGAELHKITMELGGALLLGAVAAVLLNILLRILHDPDKNTALAVALILLTISFAAAFGMDVILATMMVGFTLTNIAPRRSEDLFNLMRNFAIPIYILFFVMVGARLALGEMPGWLWGLVALYLVGRSGGKYIGAYLGARLTGAAPTVRRYLGLGLAAQGGVAVGLSIMAGQHLTGIQVTETINLGDLVIFCVTATTLIVQFIGPPVVKLAITLADEINRNVTEGDVIASMTAADVMNTDFITIPEQEPLQSIIHTISENDYYVYPVTGPGAQLVGAIRLNELKELLEDQESWEWLVAVDIMSPTPVTEYAATPLARIIQRMDKYKFIQVTILASEDDRRPVGIIDRRQTAKFITAETWRRRDPQAALAEPA